MRPTYEKYYIQGPQGITLCEDFQAVRDVLTEQLSRPVYGEWETHPQYPDRERCPVWADAFAAEKGWRPSVYMGRTVIMPDEDMPLLIQPPPTRTKDIGIRKMAIEAINRLHYYAREKEQPVGVYLSQLILSTLPPPGQEQP